MKIKDCIRFAADALTMGELSKLLQGAAALSGGPKTEYEELLPCVRAVVGEIVSEYTKVIKSDAVNASGGLLHYKNFTAPPLEVLSVTAGKSPVSYQTEYGGVRPVGVSTGRFTVTYGYIPVISDGSEAGEFENPKINERVVGLGVAAEYCIRTGLTEEAVLWDRRYKDALTAAAHTTRGRKVKARAWR
jgi:hypothetical protein